ncbi:MAG: UDP-N-acetylmuramoyl-tripeptide--D-alanyl-D-alanine ligase [Proteobacteria bacterium]|nr:UDP-N-acetylmuramoyl-tripeptide--D-alanyl-D-alanine ligase [Pseudomonadota bacterium]
MADLAAAARWTGGALRGTNATFTRVTTDSRDVRAGDLFVALAGERFDGHAFVAGALAAGAVGAIVAAEHADALPGNLVAVADTLSALQALALHWRAQFAVPLIVVTGSNGKTTVKEMTAAILRTHSSPVLATAGNFNNAIGLPLTLLALRAAHRAAVVELGMNHRGETRELAAIAQPTIALVNNAQREHQEFMATVDAVADEHADAIRALPRGGHAIVNADDARADVWRRAAHDAGATTITFGVDAAADVTATVALDATGTDLAVRTPRGDFAVRLALPGIAMARNALAATAAALAAGATPAAAAAALAAFRPVAGRLARAMTPAGATVIDDTYNANPDSVRAAIDVLARAAAPRWLILGDMGEVGGEGVAFHREIGAYARAAGIERLLAAGPAMRDAVGAFGAGATHFDDGAALAAALAADAPPAVATVLVKGSRFMRMERAVAALTGTPAAGAH